MSSLGEADIYFQEELFMSRTLLVAFLSLIFLSTSCFAEKLVFSPRPEETSYDEFLDCFKVPCESFHRCFYDALSVPGLCESKEAVLLCDVRLSHQAARCSRFPDSELMEFLSLASLATGLPIQEAGKFACLTWTTIYLTDHTLLEPSPLCL
ncbi:MAG: hypothetical protein KDD64_06390 [Bdellovibrionales bacterium]|nr:hypothetical protein [Bdellovibrionales bacterium]